MRNPVKLVALATASVLGFTISVSAASVAGQQVPPSPGSSSAGDPYFPPDGNGGYDVDHYGLRLRYHPRTDVLVGRATIRARATQPLSRFNLDFVGMRVRSIRVDGAPAAWSRTRHELTVVPRHKLRKDRPFAVRVRYAGVPLLTTDLGTSGFIATDDGFVVAGEPHVAATWFPVNDHPTDKASYTFHVTVPKGLEVVANGDLLRRRPHGRWTRWTWRAPDPMASYLATVDVGQFRTDAYRKGGIRYHDAIDPDLFDPVAAPSSGTRFAVSQAADSSYKRLTRRIAVPAGGAAVGFDLTRATELGWDFAFVEAHTVGQDDWTTLPDVNGHTSRDTGESCLVWPDLHPFISEQYQTVDQEAETCDPAGATGEWWAASGSSKGPERWRVDLTEYAGSTVELSIAYASDQSVQEAGLFVDDVKVSTGAGTTSFENGLDGWTVPGPPAGSPGNENDWIAGTTDAVPPPPGEIAADALARQPEIVGFLASVAGRYPWPSAGGIVDDVDLGFALETQTRPIYSKFFFGNPVDADSVVVHELAHQWYGDSLAVKRWRDIWLNEGFATYTEWLWSQREGLETPQEIFDFFISDDFAPADDEFWQLTIGDPGREHLFDSPVYVRGAMTLHRLRHRVGDADFFRILRVWAQSRAGDNVTTRQFVRLSERISGEQLDGLFRTWLFTPGRPAVAGSGRPERSSQRTMPSGAAATFAIAKREASASPRP
jgi:hypothetical protein